MIKCAKKMRLSQYIENIKYDKNSVVTIGTFDGVHLAHQRIIETTVKLAKERKGRSVVVTFEPHPREVLNEKTEMRLLTTLKERKEYCEQLGVDWLAVIEFNKNFSQQTFDEFYLEYVVNGIGVSAAVEGYDHHWGKNREGNIQALEKLGIKHGFDVVKLEQFNYDGVPVSSSLIRNEIVNGFVDKASVLLGRPYSLSGNVIEGDKRGRTLGYPTANVDLTANKKILPKDGIYFVRVQTGDGKYFGMASIGFRPTFYEEGKRIFEVNILDFDRNIYGSEIKVDFLQRLRDEQKFESKDQLIKKMHEDEQISRELLIKYLNKE